MNLKPGDDLVLEAIEPVAEWRQRHNIAKGETNRH
jgi:hypothetical protein